MLKIPQCLSLRVGELSPAPWTNSKLLPELLSRASGLASRLLKDLGQPPTPGQPCKNVGIIVAVVKEEEIPHLAVQLIFQLSVQSVAVSLILKMQTWLKSWKWSSTKESWMFFLYCSEKIVWNSIGQILQPTFTVNSLSVSPYCHLPQPVFDWPSPAVILQGGMLICHCRPSQTLWWSW